MLDYDYYFKLFGFENKESDDAIGDCKRLAKEVQESMDYDLKNNFVTEYDIKIGMDFYKQDVLVNFKDTIVALIQYERMKERVYNLNSRGIKCEVGAIDTGDYLQFRHDRFDDESKMDTYIVRSRTNVKFGRYMEGFLLNCQHTINLLDDMGKVKSFPVSFSDNRDRLDERDSQNILYNIDSYECYIQNNEVTGQLLDETDRVLIYDNKSKRYLALRVVGNSPFSMDGLITLKFRSDSIDPNADNLEKGVADYYKKVQDLEPEPSETLYIVGSDKIRTGRTGKYKLSNSQKRGRWSIEDDDTLSFYVEDDVCNVVIPNDSSFIGKQFTLRCETRDKIMRKRIIIIGY